MVRSEWVVDLLVQVGWFVLWWARRLVDRIVGQFLG